MKFIGIILFALSCAFVTVTTHNVTMGYRSWNDILLLKENIIIQGTVWQPRPNYNLTYPSRGNYFNNRTISFIQIKDLSKYQNGGSPILLSGGIGFKHVQFLLKPQTSNGLNLTAEIWGR